MPTVKLLIVYFVSDHSQFLISDQTVQTRLMFSKNENQGSLLTALSSFGKLVIKHEAIISPSG